MCLAGTVCLSEAPRAPNQKKNFSRKIKHVTHGPTVLSNNNPFDLFFSVCLSWDVVLHIFGYKQHLTFLLHVYQRFDKVLKCCSTAAEISCFAVSQPWNNYKHHSEANQKPTMMTLKCAHNSCVNTNENINYFVIILFES